MEKLRPLSLLLLRIGAGVVLMGNGYPKFWGRRPEHIDEFGAASCRLTGEWRASRRREGGLVSNGTIFHIQLRQIIRQASFGAKPES